MANDLFENGDPWDHILELTANLQKVIVSHNELAVEVIRQRDLNVIARAQIIEMKTILLNNGLFERCLNK